MSRISTAATTLCKWVHAMVVYSDVACEVGPKREKLMVMQKQLAEVNAALQKKKDQLDEVNAKVAELKRQCDETMAQKQDLEFQSEQTKARLMRAEKLTVGLADEQIRWAEQVNLSEIFKSKNLLQNFHYKASFVRMWSMWQYFLFMENKCIPQDLNFLYPEIFFIPCKTQYMCS